MPSCKKVGSKIPVPSKKRSVKLNKARPVPDFRKLHEQWSEKLNKGKACTKKPCTVVDEFHLTTSESRLRSQQENIDPESHDFYQPSDDEFCVDQSALDSIVSNQGVKGVLTDRATIAGSNIRSGEQTKVKRKILGDLTSDSNSQKVARGRVQTNINDRHVSRIHSDSNSRGRIHKEINSRGPREQPRIDSKKSQLQNLGDFEFESDPSALAGILNNRGIQNVAPRIGQRQTISTMCRTPVHERQSIYYKRPADHAGIHTAFSELKRLTLSRLTDKEVTTTHTPGNTRTVSESETRNFLTMPSVVQQRNSIYVSRVESRQPQNQDGLFKVPKTPGTARRIKVPQSPVQSPAVRSCTQSVAKANVRWADILSPDADASTPIQRDKVAVTLDFGGHEEEATTRLVPANTDSIPVKTEQHVPPYTSDGCCSGIAKAETVQGSPPLAEDIMLRPGTIQCSPALPNQQDIDKLREIEEIERLLELEIKQLELKEEQPSPTVSSNKSVDRNMFISQTPVQVSLSREYVTTTEPIVHAVIPAVMHQEECMSTTDPIVHAVMQPSGPSRTARSQLYPSSHDNTSVVLGRMVHQEYKSDIPEAMTLGDNSTLRDYNKDIQPESNVDYTAYNTQQESYEDSNICHSQSLVDLNKSICDSMNEYAMLETKAQLLGKRIESTGSDTTSRERNSGDNWKESAYSHAVINRSPVTPKTDVLKQLQEIKHQQLALVALQEQLQKQLLIQQTGSEIVHPETSHSVNQSTQPKETIHNHYVDQFVNPVIENIEQRNSSQEEPMQIPGQDNQSHALRHITSESIVGNSTNSCPVSINTKSVINNMFVVPKPDPLLDTISEEYSSNGDVNMFSYGCQQSPLNLTLKKKKRRSAFGLVQSNHVNIASRQLVNLDTNEITFGVVQNNLDNVASQPLVDIYDTNDRTTQSYARTVPTNVLANETSECFSGVIIPSLATETSQCVSGAIIPSLAPPPFLNTMYVTVSNARPISTPAVITTPTNTYPVSPHAPADDARNQPSCSHTARATVAPVTVTNHCLFSPHTGVNIDSSQALFSHSVATIANNCPFSPHMTARGFESPIMTPLAMRQYTTVPIATKPISPMLLTPQYKATATPIQPKQLIYSVNHSPSTTDILSGGSLLSSSLSSHQSPASNDVTSQGDNEYEASPVSFAYSTPTTVTRMRNRLVEKISSTAMQRFHDALLEEEVALYTCRLTTKFTPNTPVERCFTNPVARTLDGGDAMHFLPISPEVIKQWQSREGSAFQVRI